VYLIGYGIGRFWIEGLRIDPSHEVAGLRWNQWVALAAVAAGAIYLVVTRGKKWDEQPRVVIAEGPDDELDGRSSGVAPDGSEPEAASSDAEP
jgi:hypothetical protein